MRTLLSNQIRNSIIIAILLPLSFIMSHAIDLEVYQIKKAVWPNNPANFIRSTTSDKAIDITMGIGSTGDLGYGLTGISMQVPSNLVISATVSGTIKPMDQNAFIGFIVDYHTPSGFIRRTAFTIGAIPERRDDYSPIWGKGSIPDSIKPARSIAPDKYELDLASDAPIGWDNIIWLNGIIENTGANTEFHMHLDGTRMIPDTKSSIINTNQPISVIDWKVIPITGRKLFHGPLNDAESKALAVFTSHTSLSLPSDSLDNLTDTQRNTPLLVIGKYEDLKSHFENLSDSWFQLLKDTTPWKQKQGYLLKYYPAKDLLIAVADGSLGLIYAISHLQRSIVDSPEPGIALESFEMLEKPNTEERGVYINIAYGLSCGPITTDNWNEADWEHFIDEVVLSRATFWSFYLWTETEFLYPDSTMGEYISRNEHLFKMLTHAIDYTHKRGLRSVFLFTPTNIPADMVSRHPEWACQLEYTNNGGICSHKQAAYEMVKLTHQYEMDYFKNVDEFDISFYDPGGCMCSECRNRDTQLQQLLKQINDFSNYTWNSNSQIRFGFWTWAVWRYERIHQYSMKDLLLPEVAKIVKGRENQVIVIDSFHGDTGSVPYFEEAKRQGFRTSNFVYQTNIEDGNVFMLPLFDFQRKWATMSQELHLDENFLMIMEVKSKYPMAHFGCEFFWDAALTKDKIAERYSLQLTGNLEATRLLQEGFLKMDELTYSGVIGTNNPLQLAQQIRACFDKGIHALPEDRQDQLKYLHTTAKIYQILVHASTPRIEKDAAALQKDQTEYMSILRSDPMFEYFANSRGEAFFDRLVGWLSNGFKQGYY